MAKSLIFIGGKGPERLPDLDIKAYKEIICADSGYDMARSFDIMPDLVIGDMDSTRLREEIVNKGFIPCPHDKDDSDFVLALKSANGCYDLVGGGEGRLDHLISIFSAFHNFGPPKMWLTHEDVIFSSSHFSASLEPGYPLSFFPADLSSRALVTTHGLEWDLSAHEISLSFISLSNRCKNKNMEITSSVPLFIRFPMDFFSSGAKIITC